MKYLLDTHVWIWWHSNPKKLSKKVMDIISSARNYDEMLLSVISIWEFCKLVEKERLVISCDPQEWIKQALDMPKLKIVQLSTAISLNSTTLPGSFHSDPADQILVATAREENATILSADTKIRTYKFVKTIW